MHADAGGSIGFLWMYAAGAQKRTSADIGRIGRVKVLKKAGNAV